MNIKMITYNTMNNSIPTNNQANSHMKVRIHQIISEELKILIGLISVTEIEPVIQHSPKGKATGQNVFTGKFYI